MIDEVSSKNVLIGDRLLLGLIISGLESAGPRFYLGSGETSLVSKLNYGLLHLSNLIHRSRNTVVGFSVRQ